MVDALVAMSGITKRFGGAQVVDHADLALRPGKLHALLGPNGAGKSTMIKILSGAYRADGGSVLTWRRNGDATARMGFIHQNLAVVDGLSVRENIFLCGDGPRLAPGVIDARGERSGALRSLAAVQSTLHTETPLGGLSLGEKTFVAMARLRTMDVDVMVLDETSAALTRRESDWLYGEARRFADSGGAVLVVTHRLGEVTKHCDEATVMADGKVVFAGPTPSLADIHQLMAAGTEETPAPGTNVDPGRVVAQLRGARTDAIGPVDLQVHQGEVLALVGPLSSNLYQIGHLLAGHAKLRSGARDVSGAVALVPENCQAQAMLPGLSVRENMTIGELKRFSSHGRLIRRRENSDVGQQIRALDISPADPRIPVELLSGGNQQKVILARTALSEPRCYVLCEPTRGVDVKTRRAIYRFIRAASAAGAAVVVITIDVDDAYAVAHRIGLVRAGGLLGAVHARDDIPMGTILEEVDS